MAQAQHKDISFNIRAQSLQKNLIDKAAKILNKNRSDFILEVACREAENVLLDKNLFLVDENAYQDFSDLLEAPIENNAKLKILLAKKSPWEK